MRMCFVDFFMFILDEGRGSRMTALGTCGFQEFSNKQHAGGLGAVERSLWDACSLKGYLFSGYDLQKSGIFPNTFLRAFASCLTFGRHSFMSCCDAEYHATRELEKRLSSVVFGLICICPLLLHSESLICWGLPLINTIYQSYSIMVARSGWVV